MQIVIDLPEKTIAHIRSAYGHGKGFYPLNEEDKKIVNDAIYFCTPLPKGHGRLIDADAITKDVETLQNSFVINVDNMTGKILGCACLAPTIIEGSDSE